MLVAERAEVAQELAGDEADAALALDRLDHDRRRLRTDRRLDRLDVAERHLVEALGDRAEAFEVFRVAGGGERGQRPAVEGAGEGDDAVALGMAADELVAARGLDRAFDRLGAGIAEEDLVGEASARQSVSASASCPGMRKRLETCQIFSACSVSAATSSGWAWPSELTAMPPAKSRESGGRRSSRPRRPRRARRRAARARTCHREVSGPSPPRLFIQGCSQKSKKCRPEGSTLATRLIAPRAGFLSIADSSRPASLSVQQPLYDLGKTI